MHFLFLYSEKEAHSNTIRTYEFYFLEFHANIVFCELPVDPRDRGRAKNTYLHEINPAA